MKKKKILIFIVIILFTMSIPLIGFVDLPKDEMLSSIKIYPNMKELQLNESLIAEKIAMATFKEDKNEIIENLEVATNPTRTNDENAQKSHREKPQKQENSKTNEQMSDNKVAKNPNTVVENNNASTFPITSTNIKHFERNDNTITEMENCIKSNPSETMEKLGYNIVHDSNIVNQTTGFTYSQKRIKDAIKKSFGTIKIYAHDYYVNGKFVETRCFIM